MRGKHFQKRFRQQSAFKFKILICINALLFLVCVATAVNVHMLRLSGGDVSFSDQIPPLLAAQDQFDYSHCTEPEIADVFNATVDLLSAELKAILAEQSDNLQEYRWVKMYDYCSLLQFHYVQWSNPCVLDVIYGRDFATFWPRFLKPGENAIDIGTQAGDTLVPIAAATRGGTTVGFEIAPLAFFMAQKNVAINEDVFDIDIYNVGIDKEAHQVVYSGVGNQCNGGIVATASASHAKSDSNNFVAQTVHLPTFLASKYSQEFIQNIGFIKIDTEGHDVDIVRSMLKLVKEAQPALMIEFYAHHRNKGCAYGKVTEYWSLLKALPGYSMYCGHFEKIDQERCTETALKCGDLLLLPDSKSHYFN